MMIDMHVYVVIAQHRADPAFKDPKRTCLTPRGANRAAGRLDRSLRRWELHGISALVVQLPFKGHRAAIQRMREEFAEWWVEFERQRRMDGLG